MLHTYEQKSQSRDELVREARRAIRKLTQEMARSIYSHPEIEQKMEQLAGQLETVKGSQFQSHVLKENRYKFVIVIGQVFFVVYIVISRGNLHIVHRSYIKIARSPFPPEWVLQ